MVETSVTGGRILGHLHLLETLNIPDINHI